MKGQEEEEISSTEGSYAVYQPRVVLAGERAVPDAGNELAAQPAAAAGDAASCGARRGDPPAGTGQDSGGEACGGGGGGHWLRGG